MMEQETKVCTKCGVEKPLSEFNKNKNYSDGHRSDCRMCRREYREQRAAINITNIADHHLKTCIKCGIEKQLIEFYNNKSNKDGRHSYCKPCHIEHRKQIAVTYTKNYIEQDLKTCITCGITKPISEYYNDNNFRDLRQPSCKTCFNKRQKQYKNANREQIIERSKQYRNSNREQIREHQNKYRHANKKQIIERNKQYRDSNRRLISERNKQYRKANPLKICIHSRNRKARKLNAPGSHTEADIAQLLILQKTKCAVCHCSIKNGYHVDHVIPLAKGGSNDKLNLQLLCPPCNLSKNAKDPIHFMQQRGFLL